MHAQYIHGTMGYCIDGQISCRLKIELGTLGPPVIKVVLSAYSSTCQEQLGTKLTSGKNYWGKYGPLLLFAIRVDKHFAFIFLITWFSQNTEGYDISTLTNFQVINPTRSYVFLLQSFFKGTCEIISEVPHHTTIQQDNKMKELARHHQM